jgi:hypothetical protein
MEVVIVNLTIGVKIVCGNVSECLPAVKTATAFDRPDGRLI